MLGETLIVPTNRSNYLKAEGGLPSGGLAELPSNKVLLDSTGVNGLLVSKERTEDLASATMFALVRPSTA